MAKRGKVMAKKEKSAKARAEQAEARVREEAKDAVEGVSYAATEMADAAKAAGTSARGRVEMLRHRLERSPWMQRARMGIRDMSIRFLDGADDRIRRWRNDLVRGRVMASTPPSAEDRSRAA